MQTGWNEFLRASGQPGHGAQVYREVGELAESVASYLSVGFDLREPALVVATPDHWTACAEQLAAAGWDAPRLAQHELLVLVDAEETLAAISDGGRPSERTFDEVIGSLLDAISDRHPEQPIRIYGEMVDLLSARGDVDGAIELESLWNRLSRRRPFTLLCGYGIDVFDLETQSTLLPAICRAHSHVLPAEDPERLHRAVDAALAESLGSDSGKVYALAAQQVRRKDVPAAELALMWVSSQMPLSAGRILESARAHYLAEPAA